MNTLRDSFRQPEVQSTFMPEKKSGRLVIEVSLMEKRSILSAQLVCVKVCEKNLLCGFLSFFDIAKRFCCEQRKTLTPFSVCPAPGIDENF